MNTVDQVIACHDRQWLRFSDCDFKSFKVYFAECTLGNHTVRSHTVVFLVVTCEMLDGCATSIVGLYTFCHCCCDGSCHIRIFRIIFEVSSAERISVNVHSRSQPPKYSISVPIIAPTSRISVRFHVCASKVPTGIAVQY